MQTIKSILNRLNNKGTILAIVGLVLSLLIQLGFEIQTEKITNIAQTICTLLVMAGILNDPTNGTEGYIPGISDKLVTKEEVKEEVAAPVVEEVKPVASETQAVNEVEAEVK